MVTILAAPILIGYHRHSSRRYNYPQAGGWFLTLDEFFANRETARTIFDRLKAITEELGPAQLRVTKSQIAFRRARAFAWAWTPDQYLQGNHLAPLVLSLSFKERDSSRRWKEVVQPVPGRFMHHLELRSPSEIDEEVRRWIERAWGDAE